MLMAHDICVQEMRVSDGRAVDGVSELEQVHAQAPGPSATAFRVVSQIRWHGGITGETSGVRLFVGVLTGGANADRRAAIRETWGGDKRLHRYPGTTLGLTTGYCTWYPRREAILVGLDVSSVSGRPAQQRHVRRRRVMFFSAKPTEEGVFDALRREGC